VTDGGGAITVNERLGRRRLAYPIHKHSDGVYVRFLYDAEPAVPKELERRLRLSDKILRVLTVRLEPHWATAAKEQAVRDARARAEAAERAKDEPASAARDEARFDGFSTAAADPGSDPDEREDGGGWDGGWRRETKRRPGSRTDAEGG
jgi:small subunit ribosomal protein S6